MFWLAVSVGIICFSAIVLFQLRALHEVAKEREITRRQDNAASAAATEKLMEREAQSSTKVVHTRQRVDVALAEAESHRARYHVEQSLLAQQVAKSLEYNFEKRYPSEETRNQLAAALTRQLDGEQRPPAEPAVKLDKVPEWGGEKTA